MPCPDVFVLGVFFFFLVFFFFCRRCRCRRCCRRHVALVRLLCGRLCGALVRESADFAFFFFFVIVIGAVAEARHHRSAAVQQGGSRFPGRHPAPSPGVFAYCHQHDIKTCCHDVVVSFSQIGQRPQLATTCST